MPYTTDTAIILYVDTASILQYQNSQTEEVKSCVYLADNQGDIDPPDKSNFTSYLSGNSQIAWFGAVLHMAPNLRDYVLISDIIFKPAHNGIGIQKRNPNNGSGDTHIDGFIPGNGNKNTGIETDYTINFAVFRNGSSGDYSIDPKLIMR